jgi:hypothetical protein
MVRPWLKLYSNLLDKPKVMLLPADTFKAWVLLLVVANRHGREGLLPPVSDCAFILHSTADKLQPHIDVLMDEMHRLIEHDPETGALRLHDWEEWQTKPPSAAPEAVAERQRLSRQRRREVTTSDVSQDLASVTNGHEASQVSRRDIRDLSATAVESGVSRDVTSVTTERRGEEIRGEEELAPQPPAKTPRKRGSGARIPADFALTDEMWAEVEHYGIPHETAESHALDFRRYWLDATKNYRHNNWPNRWIAKFGDDVRSERVRPPRGKVVPLRPQSENAFDAIWKDITFELGRWEEGNEIPTFQAQIEDAIASFGGWQALWKRGCTRDEFCDAYLCACGVTAMAKNGG